MFSQTKVIRLFANVFKPNKGSMHVLEKCGFKQEAILEKAFYKSGEYYDNHIYAKIKNQ